MEFTFLTHTCTYSWLGLAVILSCSQWITGICIFTVTDNQIDGLAIAQPQYTDKGMCLAGCGDSPGCFGASITKPGVPFECRHSLSWNKDLVTNTMYTFDEPTIAVPGCVKVWVTTTSKKFGPLSGGTRMAFTVNTEALPLVTGVMIGGQAASIERSSGVLYVYSPPGSVLRVAQPIVLKYTTDSINYQTFTTNHSFTYLPDPKITEIHPLQTIRSGGTRLTAVGHDLNSIGIAILEVTLTPKVESGGRRRRRQAGQPITIKVEQVCDQQLTQTSLICLTPNTSALIGEDQIQDHDYLVAFKLEGAMTNLLEANLQLYPDPVLKNWTAERIIRNGQHLVIKGTLLDKGCMKDDYRVKIGLAECVVTDLKPTRLTCLPPRRPGRSSIDRGLEDNTYLVQVQAGYTSQVLGPVTYYTHDIILYVILACSVVGALCFVVAVNICVWAAYRTDTKDSSSTSSQRQREATPFESQGEHDNMDEGHGPPEAGFGSYEHHVELQDIENGGLDHPAPVPFVYDKIPGDTRPGSLNGGQPGLEEANTPEEMAQHVQRREKRVRPSSKDVFDRYDDSPYEPGKRSTQIAEFDRYRDSPYDPNKKASRQF